jgi:DNA-binding NarL/FixJ family response regulator
MILESAALDGRAETPAAVLSECRPQKILVVNENELVAAGLSVFLRNQPWVSSCLIAKSADIAWQVARTHHPSLVIVSTSLGGRSGTELCRLFKERMPYVRVVLLSAEGSVPAASARAHGAVASLSLLTPAAAMVAAVKRVAEGGRVFAKQEPSPEQLQLSRRERDVLRHMASGLSNPEVAARLNLSRHTVKQHTSAVYRKLGVRNRAQASSRAQELGLVS